MSNEASIQTRLPYRAPMLQVHGDFRQLTLGGQAFCPDGQNSSKNPAQAAAPGVNPCVQAP